MNNSEMTEKAIFLSVVLFLIVAGIVHHDDFKGQSWVAVVWFSVLGLSASRLIYFLIKKR